MLKYLEKSTILQVIVLFVAVVLLWGGALLHPVPMPAPVSYGPLYEVLYNLTLPPLVGVILAMLMVLAGGLMLNLMLANAGLVSQNSLLPALLYILFMSADATTLTPTLIVGVLDIAFVSMLMLHGTLLAIPPSKICGAAVLVGICSLFYLPALSLLLTYLLVAVNYRLYNWREAMVMLLGLLAPYILLWTILFMTGSLMENLQAITRGLQVVHRTIGDHHALSAFANLSLALVLAASIFNLWNHLKERTVVWKKNAATVMLTAVTGTAMLFYTQLFPVNLQFFALAFALCGTHLLLPERRRSIHGKRQWREHINDILFILIIIAAILA